MTEINDNDQITIDPDDPPSVELEPLGSISTASLSKLEELDVVNFETVEKDGETVLTDCMINMRNLSAMATDFHIVERRYGDRWGLGSWDPDIRLLKSQE